MVPQLEMPAGGEWVVIFIVVFLLFGAKRVPELTRSVAQAMKEFKKIQKEDETPPAVESSSKTGA
ncbi:hypothetical protein GCM10029976_040860 [Kribbella albertanoniae]|uniref:Twin-arginine translocase TatA/TatE family subunit n=1 Tax=Kribbella albertanoniae TaxID=1266829 RepID=A0A4V2XN08_9ACTN|nr:twin-arginine translocase TatA/TatE family subunit [Kribbella albertanoniae]TDC16246.1 twin-arginine translocase TatA/TatE family subunit [Kribbella albertanoniae]